MTTIKTYKPSQLISAKCTSCQEHSSEVVKGTKLCIDCIELAIYEEAIMAEMEMGYE